MSAQTTIANLRQENLVKTALLKRACGEPLNAQEKEVMEEIAKARALDRRLRETYTLEGVIEKVLREPTSNQTFGDPGSDVRAFSSARGAADVLDAGDVRKT